jgi:hypothetical protein
MRNLMPSGEPPILRGQRILLRPPRPNDKQDRLKIGLHPEYERLVGGNLEGLSTPTAEAADRRYAVLSAEPLGWVIEFRGRAIGEAKLHRVERSAEPASTLRYQALRPGSVGSWSGDGDHPAGAAPRLRAPEVAPGRPAGVDRQHARDRHLRAVRLRSRGGRARDAVRRRRMAKRPDHEHPRTGVLATGG